MNRLTVAILCAYTFFLVSTGIYSSDLKIPHLTPYSQNLIEKTRLGTIDERISAIDECGVGRYSVCYYALIELLNDPSPEIRSKTALSLGLLRIDSAIPHIEKFLNQEKEESVKIALIRSLIFLRNNDATTLASKYLTSDSEAIRFNAAKVLSRNSSNGLYDTILERIKNESSDRVKIVLLHAALKIKKTEPEMKNLVEYFYSTQRNLRMVSAKAARDLKLKEFLQPLRKAIVIERDPDVLDELYQAYTNTYFK